MNVSGKMPQFSRITLEELGINQSPQQLAYSADVDGLVTVQLPTQVNISSSERADFSVVSVGLREAATDNPEVTFYDSDNNSLKVPVEKDNDQIVFPTVDLVG
jgi:hypothetical protein